jgi:glycosyltransferase involved in cell wall biosynthesis
VNILFLTHYFPPEVNAPASRTLEHCREWVRHGHTVTVVTNTPNHPRGEVYPGYRNRLCQREETDGIRVVRLLTYVTANEGIVKRTLNFIVFFVMSVLAAPFLPRPDIVVSTSPQFFAGLAGFAVSRLKRAPWVLEIRDLWPESILSVGAIANPTAIRLLEGLEAFAYRKADAIVSVTDAFKPHIEARGGAGKVSVIKNGVDLSLFSAAPRDDAFAKELNIDHRFVAAYVGTHGMAHGLDTVLDAARRLDGQSNVVFLLVGEGSEKRRLREKRDALGLTNVVMLGQQPKEGMPRVWSVADVSLVLLRKLDLFTTVIPSKIFESMAMGKPILLGVRGESRALIEEAGAGIGIEPEDAVALAVAVQTLESDRALYQRMAERGPAYVREHFDRRKLALRYLALLETLRRR